MKAAEFRAWLLDLSPLVLREKLPEKFYNHWCLLVLGISLLLGPSNSPADLEIASYCLEEFYSQFEGLCGLRWMSINIHHLKHLITLAKKYGPLWAVSCFPFESMNHMVRKLIHGTGSVLSQVFFLSFFFFFHC